jgi:hypothetical protein
VDHYFKVKAESKKTKNLGQYQLSKLILNSLYGRMGLKYSDTETEIVSSKEAKDICLNYRVIENHSLNIENDLEYIKYKTFPSSNLFDLDREKYLEKYLESVRKSNNNKISRSIIISIFTTTYSNIFMNKFLNLIGNPCIYTDTDSVFLEKPLDPQYVGDEIGQFKFEGLVKKGYFIAPKLYCLEMNNEKIIIKSKGVISNKLNIQNFKDLIEGKSISIESQKFRSN